MPEKNTQALNHSASACNDQSLTVSSSKGNISFLTRNIIRIQGLSSYSKIFFADNRHPLTVSIVLKRLQMELPEALFIRPHRTHLVNKNFVSHISTMGSNSCLLLQNGESIAISRRKISAVREKTGTVSSKN